VGEINFGANSMRELELDSAQATVWRSDSQLCSETASSFTEPKASYTFCGYRFVAKSEAAPI
jgi:hypothetical protein